MNYFWKTSTEVSMITSGLFTHDGIKVLDLGAEIECNILYTSIFFIMVGGAQCFNA